MSTLIVHGSKVSPLIAATVEDGDDERGWGEGEEEEEKKIMTELKTAAEKRCKQLIQNGK